MAKRSLRRYAPEVGAECLNWARSDLCGGRSAMTVPTAIVIIPALLQIAQFCAIAVAAAESGFLFVGVGLYPETAKASSARQTSGTVSRVLFHYGRTS